MYSYSFGYLKRQFVAVSTLINRVIKEATQSKFRQVTLETQNTNVPAITFYRKQGFLINGLRLGLYDPSENPGEIAIFMVYRTG